VERKAWAKNGGTWVEVVEGCLATRHIKFSKLSVGILVPVCLDPSQCCWFPYIVGPASLRPTSAAYVLSLVKDPSDVQKVRLSEECRGVYSMEITLLPLPVGEAFLKTQDAPFGMPQQSLFCVNGGFGRSIAWQ
jgi:hypothetical protein